ncbi:putative oxygenase MesX [Microbacterium halophytorum]|uniref:putative oxygenase MesX n=1 Tax=Microbacterium halophytorum TaxID=2067568 RepID=UPI000CFCAE8B|nr:putative oxygenase MesX [Microbacterium halophytorum]
MATEFTFSIRTTPFDEDYSPAADSRATTNFANLARGDDRRRNLRGVLAMIDGRFNELAAAENPNRDRYHVELEIVSVDLHLTDGASGGTTPGFPLIEILDVTILDRATGERIKGISGNNFSSYVRDYDFSVRLPQHKAVEPGLPGDFGELHGKLFQHFLASDAYRERFALSPVICISVSTSRTYQRLGNRHPVLGVEYGHDADSLTDEYFGKMGLQVRYFMPDGSVAPLAFYHRGDLEGDYSDLALAGTIATMEAFQKIYRPEIYNANEPAGEVYRPTLENADYTVLDIAYDREERAQLGKTQGRFTDEHFITPYREVLDEWAATRPLALAGAEAGSRR